MDRHYEWARRNLPRGDWWCLGDVAMVLGLSRYAVARRLRRHGLGKVITRRWRDPVTGLRYGRRLWIIREAELVLLISFRFERELRAMWALSPSLRRPFPGAFRTSRWRLRQMLVTGKRR